MSRTRNPIQSIIYGIALLGGGAAFAYANLKEILAPFIPLFVTIVGSLIAGLLVRQIFVSALNRRISSSYRYT